MKNYLIAGAAFMLSLSLLSAPADAVEKPIPVQKISARDTPDYTTKAVCQDFGKFPEKTACIKVQWFDQADNTGVNLWVNDFRTTNGCGSLEDEDNGRRKYGNAEAKWQQSGKTAKEYTYIGYHSCDPAFFSSWKGADKGPMVYRFRTKARVNFDPDYYLCWKFTLWPGGLWDIYTEKKMVGRDGDRNKCNPL